MDLRFLVGYTSKGVFSEVQCFNSIHRRTTIPSIYIDGMSAVCISVGLPR